MSMDKEKQVTKSCKNCVCNAVCDKKLDLKYYFDNHDCKHYQPKISEDSVVLSKEEYEEYQKFKSFLERNDWESVEHIETTLDKCQEVLYERLKQSNKETAEKYFNAVIEMLKEVKTFGTMDIKDLIFLHEKNKEIAKQFCVEIKEK